jgi:hypothetical protein
MNADPAGINGNHCAFFNIGGQGFQRAKHPGADLSDNHTHRYPHTPDTGLSPHHRGILGNPVKQRQS